jgi:hypothetical protein
MKNDTIMFLAIALIAALIFTLIFLIGTIGTGSF